MRVNPLMDWIGAYKKKDALWIHDGNPKRPHALLTSGKHSNGFFNSRLVIPDEVLLTEAALDLVEIFASAYGGYFEDVEVVVGPQTGATKLAELVSGEFAKKTNSQCFSSSPAKGEIDGERVMIFSDEDLKLLSGKSVLLCEDVISTGGSIDLTAEAVVNAGGVVMPYVLTLVNRSGLSEIGCRRVISLIDREMPMWEPDDCPLCKQGSEAVRPKDNWKLLNAEY